MKQIFAAILLGLGIPQAKIDTILAIPDDQAKDFKTEELIAEVTTGFKSKFSNDQDFLNSIPEDKVPETTRKKIESGQYARFQNELIEVAIKKLGLDEKTTFTEEDKKSIKTLAEKMARTFLAKNNGTEGLTKLQTELQAALADKEQLETDWTKKLADRETELNSGFDGKMIKTLTKLHLSSLDKIKLIVPPEYLTEKVLSKMNDKFKVVLNGEELEIKQKDNPTLDVLDKGGKKIGYSDALRSLVLEDKIGTQVTEEDLTGGGKKKIKVDGGSEGNETGEIEVASYINEKMKVNIDAEAKVTA